MASFQTVTWLLALSVVVVAASGCAQWQQSPDAMAASVDDAVLAKCAALLKEFSPETPLEPPAAASSEPPAVEAANFQQRPPEPTVDATAPEEQEAASPSPEESAPPAADASPTVDQNLPPGNESIAAAAAAPESIPPVKKPTTAGKKLAKPSTMASPPVCDACCDSVAPGVDCPLDWAVRRYNDCPLCLGGERCKLFTRPEPGPPPVRYRPALPPKFLPVPTQPVMSPARPDAPDPWRGDVEWGFRPRITFPGRD